MGQCICQPAEVEWHVTWHNEIPPRFERERNRVGGKGVVRYDVYKVFCRKQDKIDKIARSFDQWRERQMGPGRLCTCFFRNGTEITVGSPSRHYTLRGRPNLIWQMGDVLPTENRREMIVSYHVQDRACSGICCFLFNMIVFPCTMACRSQERYDPNRIFVPTDEEQPRQSPEYFLGIAMREVSAEQAKEPRLTSELKRLANLRSSGALTEEQYSAAVNKVIYGS